MLLIPNQLQPQNAHLQKIPPLRPQLWNLAIHIHKNVRASLHQNGAQINQQNPWKGNGGAKSNFLKNTETKEPSILSGGDFQWSNSSQSNLPDHLSDNMCKIRALVKFSTMMWLNNSHLWCIIKSINSQFNNSVWMNNCLMLNMMISTHNQQEQINISEIKSICIKMNKHHQKDKLQRTSNNNYNNKLK